MDALFPDLTRRLDPSKAVGYLNFSDGRPDARFRKLLLDAYAVTIELGDATPWQTVPRWLQTSTLELQQLGSAAFKDVTQAQEVIELAFFAVPLAYRQHHIDLLSHQPDEILFSPLFLARCAELTLAIRATGLPAERIPSRVMAGLNDYVGYRPIAILEQRPQTDFYSHERVAAVPLYFQGVGVAPGLYSDILTAALELLAKTEPDLLEEACLDLTKLDEVALDPRAIDHFHPVTKRPNVLFGEWDPHKIDGRGYYRRFVLKPTTLDALVRWTRPENRVQPDRLFEASAVLAGTMLMGTGICGSGPTHHDSTVTLATLVQKIARFRDNFYQQLLQNLPGPHGDRLRAEAAKLKQPFGGVRQYLNGAIASERAFHLQERRLAVLFAAMGYPTAARARAARIPAPATRLGAEIRLRQTAAIFAIKAGQVQDVPQLLDEAETFLKRGIDCGALIDPWNILGYQGLFPTFSDRGDTVRDPRAEELILSIGRQLDAYAQGLAAASGSGETEIAEVLRDRMQDLARWWDRFATPTVSDLPKVLGGERAEAAEHVAAALALWKTGGASNPAFWRKHHQGFTTPSAFAQVIEALLDHEDHRAALALLMTWLSAAENGTVPLQDPSASFFRLAFRWFRGVVFADSPPQERAALCKRFFELLEANAESFAVVPQVPGDASPRNSNLEVGSGSLASDPTELDFDEDEADNDDDDDDDEDDDRYSSAYEDVTFEDSADDGEEGSVADGSGSVAAQAGNFSLDGEDEHLGERLRFLATLSRLWRWAARPELWPQASSEATATISEWLRVAREHAAQLNDFTQALHRVRIPDPIVGIEGVSEFDRRRNIKGSLIEASVQTIVETLAAVRSLAAVLPRPGQLPSALGKETKGIDAWEPLAVRLERAVALSDRGAARRLLPGFIALFRHEPLLVCPAADGGEPIQAIRAQTALQMMESLLARLPRLGLLRETFHLTKLARAMERNEMPEGRRVSSFDALFRTAVTGTVDAILSAARDWGDDAGEDGPLAADLKQIADAYHKLWVEHSQTLRLSSLEAVFDRDEWEDLRKFIRKYGSDLFNVRFLSLSNIRGVIGQGAVEWLNREVEQGDSADRPRLVEDWEKGRVEKSKVARQFEIVLNALVEHYDEYRDYNTTTTQSDYGENIYILLDFLRMKVNYDRIAWRLRPMVLAHEVLCRRGYDRLAAKWREYVSMRTARLAEDSLNELTQREAEHGIKLRTVRDRLEERFVQPLQVDQAAARVPRAAAAAREGQPEDNPAFTGLLAAIQPLADSPVGVGLDVPAWVRRLEDELRKVRFADPDRDEEEVPIVAHLDEYPLPPSPPLDQDDFRAQIRDWDEPLG